MKYISILGIMIAVISALGGCAPTDTTTSAAAGDPVPGQVKGSDERLQPGVSTGGPNASVKW